MAKEGGFQAEEIEKPEAKKRSEARLALWFEAIIVKSVVISLERQKGEVSKALLQENRLFRAVETDWS